ncbi:hypothetical protein BDD12DRAFT_97902 [Trichophaea hybrida]|nr:hypothetical protein BDD12DRAFT_97902 [Trichophaea hybrida]
MIKKSHQKKKKKKKNYYKPWVTKWATKKKPLCKRLNRLYREKLFSTTNNRTPQGRKKLRIAPCSTSHQNKNIETSTFCVPVNTQPRPLLVTSAVIQIPPH